LDFISPQLEWSYSRATRNVGVDVMKHILLVGMQISTTTMESSMEIPQKVKDRGRYPRWQIAEGS
jgi:hypothetical protein